MDQNDKDFLKVILPVLIIGVIVITGGISYVNHLDEIRIAENLVETQQREQSQWNDFIYELNSKSCEELERSVRTFKSLMDESRPDSSTSSFGTWEKKHNASIEIYGDKCNE